MNRSLFINFKWRSQTIVIPELIDNIRFEHASPPNIRHIVGKGVLYAPSHVPPQVIYISSPQFWQEWIRQYIGSNYTSNQYHEFIMNVRRSREPARLVIESDIPTYDTNMLVLIDYISHEIRSGEEYDIYYDLVMYKYEKHEIKILPPPVINAHTGTAQIQVQTPPRANEQPKRDEIYTVVSGDSLSKISKKYTNTDSKWRELYDLNNSIIGNNPNKLSIGLQLNIPQKWL